MSTTKLRSRMSRANNLRAAIFGVNDGLVSNTSLILGMIGAQSNPNTVIVAGVAGLLAGAFSMAAGEYVSVQSQRELHEYQLESEKQKVNPDDLVSPSGAAIFSFFSFIIGAFLPLIPYLIQKQAHHLQSLIIITAGALFTIGMTISLFTGHSAWKGGARMLLIGSSAGAITYLIGHSLSMVI